MSVMDTAVYSEARHRPWKDRNVGTVKISVP